MLKQLNEILKLALQESERTYGTPEFLGNQMMVDKIKDMIKEEETKLEGTIQEGIDDYGYSFIKIITRDGGTIGITDYSKVTNKESGEVIEALDKHQKDIGSFRSMNQHGLGGSQWIRDINHIDYFMKSLERTVWITEKQKGHLQDFLEEMRQDLYKRDFE
jgi:hypothetical protein